MILSTFEKVIAASWMAVVVMMISIIAMSFLSRGIDSSFDNQRCIGLEVQSLQVIVCANANFLRWKYTRVNMPLHLPSIEFPNLGINFK